MIEVLMIESVGQDLWFVDDDGGDCYTLGLGRLGRLKF